MGAKIFEFEDFIVCNTRLPISLTFVDIFPHRQLTFMVYCSLNKSYTNNGVHMCSPIFVNFGVATTIVKISNFQRKS
jgi:hypothetical protein